MAFFSAVQAAAAAGRHCVCPWFARVDFASGEKLYWQGAGDIEIDGEIWTGLAELISISDFDAGRSDTASNIDLVLSGVSEAVIAAAREERSEVQGRTLSLYGHFLDAETLQPIGDFFALVVDYEMDTMQFSAAGPADYSATVTAEPIWTSARNAAAFAYFSHKDQIARFPGDLGLEQVSRFTGGFRVQWPVF